MKKSNKLLALLLVLVLAASCLLLAACGDDPAKDEQTTQYVDKIPNLSILYEGGDDLKNTYAMYVVNEDATFYSNTDFTALAEDAVTINTAGATAFVKWMSLATTRALIAAYGIEDYQESLFYLKATAPVYDGTIAKATADTKVIRLSTTTSVNDTGLLEGYLVPLFEKWYGYDVQVSSAGTGAAINAARYGNADAILVHSYKSEKPFIAEGYAAILEDEVFEGSRDSQNYNKTAAPDKNDACPIGNYTGIGTRVEFMYNYFVIVGPTTGTVSTAVAAAAAPKDAFNVIYQNSDTVKFISRGDASGTHNKEITLWPDAMNALWEGGAVTNKAEDVPAAVQDWYISAGQGMGACLTMANEQDAFILTDKGTYLRYKSFPEVA